MSPERKFRAFSYARSAARLYNSQRSVKTRLRFKIGNQESEMGILDFLSKKSPAAPAPAGATETTAAGRSAESRDPKLGLDASKINIAVDGSTVTLTGGAATTADAEKSLSRSATPRA